MTDAAATIDAPGAQVVVLAREHEIDEVMQFLRYSVKDSSTFDGTILFKFKGDDGEPALSYAVEVAPDRRTCLLCVYVVHDATTTRAIMTHTHTHCSLASAGVTTHKNATATSIRAACEVTISVDDFLWIYSGKASSSDILKLFYAGKLSISGYAFRKVSAFAQSFDFSSDKWRSFYSWRDEQESARRRSPTAVEEARNVGSPSRDFWFAHCRTVLDRYNVSKLQQLQWETSMASVFGEEYVLANVCRAIHKSSAAAAAEARRHPHDSFYAAIANVLGSSSAVIKRDGIAERIAMPSEHTQPHNHHQLDLHRELAHFFNPCTKRTATFVESVCTRKHQPQDLFGFFDEEYVNAVKYSAKERFQQQWRVKNRIDLADAGMAQLDKLVKAIGVGGHCNRTNNTQSKYIPAPELILREFNGNANVVMDLIREKALGRKSLDKIPPPNVDWLFGGRSGNVLLVDDSRMKPADTTALVAAPSASSAVPLPLPVPSTSAVATQSIVEVNRSSIQRRRSRRDFALPKQKLKAKFASLSRDLAQQNSSVIANVEDHLVFSDYL